LSTLSILPVFCAIGLAFLPAPDATTKFWFAMAGGQSFLAGFFLWTAFFNLPIYRAVAAWPREVPAADARSLILRFHQANVVRLGASLLSSLLFFLAS
jgi:predicted small integral membrane protein